jgi:chromosome segregation ATPase
MPIAQYLCDHCGKVLEEIATEKYPANMTYAPPNTISHFFQCADTNCNAKFIAHEEESGKWNWEAKDQEAFKNILKGVNERQARLALKAEKEKLVQEKVQIEKMMAENPKKISIIRKEMENIKVQVNKLTDEYEERSKQCANLDEAIKKGRKRLEEIDKRLKELIHIK